MTSATPFGQGVKQRDLIKMTQEEIDEFIAGWHTMNCATMNHDGTIHLVAMWYGFLEGCPALETKAKSQKVQNIRRDPRITCLIEDGDSYDQLRGVEMVGTAEIIEDPDRIFTMGISLVERTTGMQYTEELKPAVEAMINKRVVVKIHVDRYVSWDHRKLGLPEMPKPPAWRGGGASRGDLPRSGAASSSPGDAQATGPATSAASAAVSGGGPGSRRAWRIERSREASRCASVDSARRR